MGLIPAGMAAGRADAVLEDQLPAGWTAQHIFDEHEVFMFHGRRCRTPRNPAGGRCVVLDVCPYGQANPAMAQTAADQPSSEIRAVIPRTL